MLHDHGTYVVFTALARGENHWRVPRAHVPSASIFSSVRTTAPDIMPSLSALPTGLGTESSAVAALDRGVGLRLSLTQPARAAGYLRSGRGQAFLRGAHMRSRELGVSWPLKSISRFPPEREEIETRMVLSPGMVSLALHLSAPAPLRRPCRQTASGRPARVVET